jgi:hypothetical protein
MPGVRETKVSYKELMAHYNCAANGSDDVYWVDFAQLPKYLKKE